MRRQSIVRILCVLAVSAARAWSGAQTTQPAPSQWFVYNATLRGIPGAAARDNGFNANSQGWTWQQAGFVDANGRPFTINPSSHNIMDGTNVVGTWLENGIYRSEVANANIADLSGGATLQRVYDLMLPFANNAMGRLHLSTHGGVRVVDDVATTGGLIILDNNRTYAGFRADGPLNGGTGVPGGFKPYTIQGKPTNVGAAGGGRFNLELYSCNTGQDPDAGGAQLSVAASATNSFGRVDTTPGQTAPRVNTVTSSVPAVKCIVSVTALDLPNGVTMELFGTALNAQMAKFPQSYNGCKNVSDWLAGMAFLNHYSKLSTQLRVVNVPPNPQTGWSGGNVTPTWRLNYQQITALNRGSDDQAMDEPVTWSLSSGGMATARYNAPEGGPSASMTVSSIIGGNPEGTTLHLCAAADVDFDIMPAPSGLELATSVMRLSPYDDEFTSIAGRTTLGYNDGYDLSSLQLFRLVGDQWMPFSAFGNPSIDYVKRTFSADYNFTGAFNEIDGAVVAGFAVVPEPVSTYAIGTACLALLARRKEHLRG